MIKKNIFVLTSTIIVLSSLFLCAENTKAISTIQEAIPTHSISIKEVFSSSPLIYGFLLILSMGSVVIWLYSLLTFRFKDIMSPEMILELRNLLLDKNWEGALSCCKKHSSLLGKMLSIGISTRHHGLEFMIDNIRSEGKRLTTNNWQKVSLLNDIVMVAPMLGLLGTVLGMFYAFYDMNRSAESISSLFDGLGIAVGTTVAGLIVAILAMIFSTTLKYRLIKLLNQVENEALELSNLIAIEERK